MTKENIIPFPEKEDGKQKKDERRDYITRNPVPRGSRSLAWEEKFKKDEEATEALGDALEEQFKKNAETEKATPPHIEDEEEPRKAA